MLECTWSLDSAEMRIDGCILDTILSQSFTADQALLGKHMHDLQQTRWTRFSFTTVIRVTFESTVHLHTSYRDRIREYTKLYCMRMTMKMWPLALFVFVLAAVPPPYCHS